MKNLIHEPKNLNDLPKKENFRDPDKWHSRSDVYHFTDGISPWDRIKRILKKYKGKQFNKAFAEYCAQVPQYQQRFFLEEFEDKYNRRSSAYWSYWYVDKVGNIQYQPGSYKKNQKVYYYSDDYKTEKRHKVTGKKYPETWHDSGYWKRNKLNEDDYHYVVISGYCLEFKNAKDSEWIRLTTDQNKRRKAAERARQKEADAVALSFITKSELEAKKEKQLNRNKIERKGFDYVTSFRDDKQINPDVIRERQGF